jgi:hypothetical protein
MRLEVRTIGEAETALDYFNRFHDGFIRELTLRSHDRFEARGVHEMTGRLDLAILFAHYNYREGEPPADQLIEARFFEVRDVVADFPLTQHEWAIMDLQVEPAGEARLSARLLHHRLLDNRWTVAEGLRFTFARAELLELEPQ